MKHSLSVSYSWLTAIIFFALIAFFASGVRAQIGSNAFSPSITSFMNSSGTEIDVAAWVTTSSHHRSVGISLSTNAGTSWTTVTTSGLTAPTGYDNLDDPEIIAVGGGKLVLVVRAYNSESYTYGTGYAGTGSWLTDLPATIFAKSAILLAISTNQGTNWGYYHDESNPTSATTIDNGKWMTLAASNTGLINTVENPRIAWRQGFDTRGYVVWDSKTWTNSSTITVTDQNGNHTFTNPGLWVSASEVDMACFNASFKGDNLNSNSVDGWVFGTPYDPSSPFTSSFTTPKHFCPGPEAPSVSVSPDGEAWITYHQVAYGGWDVYTPNIWTEDDEAVPGQREPDAFIYISQGRFNPASNTFNFETPAEYMHDELLGFYNGARGYLYAKDLNSPPSLSQWDGQLVQGPQIQVACANPRGCSPSYTVGIVQAFGDGGTTGDADPRSILNFSFADLSSGATAAMFVSNSHTTSPDFTATTTQDGVDWHTSTSESGGGNSAFKFRFFPRLKWTQAPDGFNAMYPDQSVQLEPSFFVLSYMSALQNSGNARSNILDSCQCRTAVAFDNHSFTLGKSGGTTEGMVRNNETNTAGSNVIPEYWGSKIDVCGEAGKFTVHPIWHAPGSEVLKTNTGNCLLARVYLSNYDPANPLAFPLGSSTNWPISANSTGTPSYIYSPAGLFQFGSWSSSLAITQGTGATGWSFNGWIPSPATPPLNGIYNASYSQPPTNPDIGDLGFSDQRKIVMTGNIAHAVAYLAKDYYGGVPSITQIEYSTQRTIGPVTTDWSAPVELEIDPNSYFIDPPSIASYVQNSSVPQEAVAVCWGFEDDITPPNGVGIHVRVKESGNCDWSQEFVIPTSHCACAPVITPLTVPVSSGLKERYLIGWIITWEDYNDDVLNSVTLLRGGQSTGQLTQNQNWGDYSHYTPLGTQVILTGLNPSGSHEHLGATSNESNGILPDHSDEVVYTSDGTVSGCKTLNAQYYTFGTSLGNWSGTTEGKPVLDALNLKGQFDRDPSVTVTSAGQDIAAWEHIGPGPGGKGIHPKFLSSIRTARTTDLTGDWSVLQDFLTAGATDPNFHWLVNPSITAFPKTSLTGSADPHAAELLYTEKDNWDVGLGMVPYNSLHERLFNWPYGKDPSSLPWPVGNWTTIDKSPFPASGVNSQRSFGLYTTGPQYITDIHGNHSLVEEDGITPYTHGLSYGMGNAVVSGTVTDKFTTPVVGAFKGTFPQPIGEDLYRVEDRFMDSSAVEFQWGGVYVDDTALGMPAREVILNDVSSDTGLTTHEAIRDSIFQTEWFDWPVSGEVVYNRWMAFATGRFADSAVDSTNIDSLGGSQIESSSCTGSGNGGSGTITVYHPDSTVRGDSNFIQPCVFMNYTVQLVHQSGRVDTVDRMMYNPYARIQITPKTVHLVNASDFADTVQLRVVGNFSPCIPDADSNVVFGREQMLDTIGDLGDTTVAIGSGGILPPPDTCFAVNGPYTNPSSPGANDVSILVHYCGTGSAISAQVYDYLGHPIGAPSLFNSDGQVWDRLPITAPGSSGTYYITVTVGSYSATLGYSVH